MKVEYPATIMPFENEQLEYKIKVDKHGLCREIVAFANTSGGKIMIGIADDRTVVGVDKLTVEDVSNMARDGCVPPLTPKVDMEVRAGKNVIVVTVDPGQNTPYRTNSGIHHVRVGATVRIATQMELIDLMVRGTNRDVILGKSKLPQLQTQISAKIWAGGGFDQVHVEIMELNEWTIKAPDEHTKSEIIDVIDKLLRIPCSDENVISSLLRILSHLTLISLIEDPNAHPLSQKLVQKIVNIIREELFHETTHPEVTNHARNVLHALYLAGLGCIWSGYDVQVTAIVNALQSNRSRDNRLTRLCRDTADRLNECAKEEPTDQRRRLKMFTETPV